MSNKYKWIAAAVLVLGIVVIAQASAVEKRYFPLVYQEPTITPTPTATPKPTECLNQSFPNTKIKICFTDIVYKPTGSELDEWVDIKHTGGKNNPQDMTGWRISSDTGNKYDFPDGFEIKVGQTVRVYTKPGTNGSSQLYMNRTEPFWKDNEDCGYLMDDSSPRKKINSFCYSVTGLFSAPVNE